MHAAARHPGHSPSWARRSSLASSQSQWGVSSTHPRHAQVVGVRGRLHQGQSVRVESVAMGSVGSTARAAKGRHGRAAGQSGVKRMPAAVETVPAWRMKRLPVAFWRPIVARLPSA